MVSVEIEDCVPCGHLSRAQELERALLDEYGLKVDRVALVTGDGGVFTVSVDGETIYDVAEDEYEPDAIVETVGSHVGATA